MAWFEINIELKALTRELKRIADTLDRIYPPPVEWEGEPAGREAITQMGAAASPTEEWRNYAPRSNY